MVGEYLDLTSQPPLPSGASKEPPERQQEPPPGSASRRFVGVRFDCCRVYVRVYVNRDETAYEGRCPRCCRTVRLEIGPGGTDSRFFTVS
jgi:hypothetical protein